MILHLLSITILPTHTISTTVFQPLLTHNYLFLACWLSIDMKYAPQHIQGVQLCIFIFLHVFANYQISTPTSFLYIQSHYVPCIEQSSISHHIQLQPLSMAILQPTLPRKHNLTPIPSSYISTLDFLGLVLKQEY